MYKEMVKGWAKHIDFMLLDIFCLEIGFLLAYLYRNGFGNNNLPKIYERFMLMIVLIDICVVFFSSSYQGIVRRGYIKELKYSIIHCSAVTLGIITWMFMFKISVDYSRIIVGSMWVISTCLVYFARCILKKIVREKLRKDKELRKVMVVTTEARAEEIVKNLLVPFRDYYIAAVVIYDQLETKVEKIADIPVIAGKEEAFYYIKRNIVDEVFIDPNGNEKEAEHLMNVMVSMGLTAHVLMAEIGNSMDQKKISSFGNYMVVSASMKFATARQLVFKRLMDICGALVGLVFTGIAFLIFAPIIYHQSPGPIFFSQNRVGRNGRIFKIYKFRSMYMDAEERKKELMSQNKMQGLMFKMDNDPRIIPIGHFIRKTSIDELPQFWNILKGDMSLVGTRPPTVDEYKQYEMKHRKRLAMKPGLTGMWQVSGRSDIVDFEEVVALDAKYIEEWTLLLDVKMIWKTVMIVLMGKGAV